MMRYRPNCWPLIPMFIEIIMRNGRIPDDYDMSHLLFSAGAGCEAYNNNQLKRAQKFLNDHNCNARLLVTDAVNVGIPMPLQRFLFSNQAEEELTYNEMGEICQWTSDNDRL